MRTPISLLDAQAKMEAVSVPATEAGIYNVKQLHGNLALPSYVHGYSLAIEYMYNWFKSKFPKDFFRGGIYIDGKNVLDDYKRLNDYAMKNIIKGQNPRARIAPVVEYDFDREGLDLYQAPPEIYLKRSKAQDAFFKDYERQMFLGFMPRALRMDFGFKVRLNSRSEQLDTFNRMELYFRNGSTQYEYISVDFHVPKYIITSIAKRSGFELDENGEVKEILLFLEYLNQHSDLTFLFKLRAINQQPEYFIRVNNLYTHIAVRDKLQLDDGERDGKLDFNYHIEMNAILTIPVPHYYAFYSPEELMQTIMTKEADNNCVAIYSINLFEIPKIDEHGWNQGALTDCQCEKGDTTIDLSDIFSSKNNPLGRAINHNLTVGVSPFKFVNIKLYRDEDIQKEVPFTMDWSTFTIHFDTPEDEGIIHIAIYYDRVYINELDSQMNLYSKRRIKNGTLN
jgi:hypothetical protein